MFMQQRPLHNQAEVEFENEGGETYICGNPPYVGIPGNRKNKKRKFEML